MGENAKIQVINTLMQVIESKKTSKYAKKAADKKLQRVIKSINENEIGKTSLLVPDFSDVERRVFAEYAKNDVEVTQKMYEAMKDSGPLPGQIQPDFSHVAPCNLGDLDIRAFTTSEESSNEETVEVPYQSFKPYREFEVEAEPVEEGSEDTESDYYEELEKKHLGDAEKQTGIYHPEAKKSKKAKKAAKVSERR